MESNRSEKWLNPLRRRKQRLVALWRCVVGKRLALSQLKPLPSGGVRGWPTFCISLPSDKAKRRFISEQARRLSLESFSFLDAVDGRSVSRDVYTERGLYDDALARRYETSSVSASNIALCLSHFRLWSAIASAGHPATMILEDDAVFHGRRIAALDPYMFPPEWDIVFMDSYVRHKPPRGRIHGTLFSMESYRGGTAGYLVSSRGARKLLRMASVPVCHPIDHYMWWYNSHRIEGREPWKNMELPPLHEYLVYPRPVMNGSLWGCWPSAIGDLLPDY